MNPKDPRICAVRDAWARFIGSLPDEVEPRHQSAIDELKAAVLGLDGPHPAAVAYQKERAKPCRSCGVVGYFESGQKRHDGNCIEVLSPEALRQRLRDAEAQVFGAPLKSEGAADEEPLPKPSKGRKYQDGGFG